jgi:hypothetical protein
MKNTINKPWAAALAALFIISSTGCDGRPRPSDLDRQRDISKRLEINQPLPADLDYSLERHNLIRRAYWVNGQREKARMLPCPLADVPLGYAVLLTHSGAVVGKFVVEGKVTSLNAYLTADYRNNYYNGSVGAEPLADVDGAYGKNDDGIFFFTPDGKYVEWKGLYLYSDIPFEIEKPVVTYQQGK